MAGKYSLINYRLSRWMYQFTNRWDYGFKPNSSPKPNRNCKTQTLETAYNTSWFRHLNKLSMTHIQSHLNNDCTYYYLSNTSGAKVLLCIDIDAHGESFPVDCAMEAARWIEYHFFPGAYYEPSTNRQGVHMYIPTEIINRYGEKIDPFTVNDFVSDFGDHLASLVRYEGFDAVVDKICGTCTTQFNNKIKDRGHLAKIPRPQTLDDVDRLVNSPLYSMSNLRYVVDEWNRVKASEPNVPKTPLQSKKETQVVLVDVDAAAAEPLALIPDNMYGTSLNEIKDEDIDSECAWKRTCAVVRFLCREYMTTLGRFPTAEECAQYYEDNNLNTGDDKNNERIKRFERALEFYQKSFDEDKIKNKYHCDGDTYLELIKETIPNESMLKSQKFTYRNPKNGHISFRSLTFKDLSWFIGIHIRNAFTAGKEDKYIGRAARTTVMKFFDNLRDNGHHPTGCNKSKFDGMLDICVRTGILEIYKAHQRPIKDSQGNIILKGVGRLIGPGNAHPLQKEFLEFLKANEIDLNGSKAKAA